MNFWVALFFPVSPTFFVTMPEMFHGKRRILWAGGITVKIKANFRESAFVMYIIRNQCFGKTEFIFQETINFNGVKSRATEKSIR